MTLFALEGLTREYGARRVLDIPALAIEEGRIYALLGPNGAGKTTLLEILAFLDRPTEGRVRYRSRPVRFAEADLRALRREVVMVGQHPVMFSTSVFRNMEFGLRIRRVPRRERERMINEALDIVGLSGFSSAPAHRLSGGETQRVAMARALVLSPKVLLCDEPTASVDAENQEIIHGILRQINGEKAITVVFTSHDRDQAEGLAHHLLLLDRGKVARSGFENIFAGTVRQGPSAAAECLLRNGLSLTASPAGSAPARGRVRISIDPHRVAIDGAGEGEGRGNVVRGRVRQMTEVNGSVRVVVDAGLWFTVIVPAGACRERRLFVGETVDLSIPSDAVRILT